MYLFLMSFVLVFEAESYLLPGWPESPSLSESGLELLALGFSTFRGQGLETPTLAACLVPEPFMSFAFSVHMTVSLSF